MTRLPPAFDLLAACISDYPSGSRFLFDREGLGVASTSMAGVFGMSAEPVAEASIAALGRNMLARLQESSTGSNATPLTSVGQISFGPLGSATLQVPARLVRRTEPGETWLQDVFPVSDDEADQPSPFEPVRPAVGGPSAPFAPAQVTADPGQGEYARSVATAVQHIRAGTLTKVVLARTLRVEAGRTLDPVRLAHRLRAVDPHAYTFITAQHAGVRNARPSRPLLLVGASPELLVARRGRSVRSTPLAGSAPRSGDPEEDRASADGLLASEKNRHEHAIVVDAIAETLGPFCDELAWDPEPVLLETANVWHLATRFEGSLRDPAPNAVELVAALHPTPAVCGTPEVVARATIAELEDFDRGGYTGPVGWMDAEGDGEWAIALRCAELEGDRATLFAGAGIVRDSDPADEVEETDRKFRAFLDSLRWG